MSTPRTDEMEVYYSEIVTGRDGGLYWVKADFARKLESENVSMQMNIARAILQLDAACKMYVDWYHRGLNMDGGDVAGAIIAEVRLVRKWLYELNPVLGAEPAQYEAETPTGSGVEQGEHISRPGPL